MTNRVMKKIGRNDACPCGSGKKFKKCHLGREDELALAGLGEISVEEMGERIADLPAVSYGRSREMIEGLDIKNLTGSTVGVKFIDLKSYTELDFLGSGPSDPTRKGSGSIIVNLYKTTKADPDNIYVAISEDVDEATLAHQLAHVLDYLGGSRLLPGTLEPLAFELDIPVEHLEHPDEFGYWLDFIKKKFDVIPDADDSIILYLYKEKLLIKGGEIRAKNGLVLKSKSDRILRYLSEHSEEIDSLVRKRPGYIGARKA